MAAPGATPAATRAALVLVTMMMLMMMMTVSVHATDPRAPTPRQAALEALAGAILDPAAPLPWRQPPAPAWSLPTNRKCMQDITEMWNGVNDKKKWALQMADASTKIPEGLIFGNLIHLGNFDECLAVKRSLEGPIRFDGQHCLLTITTEIDTAGKSPEDTIDWESLVLGVETGHMFPTSRAEKSTMRVSMQVGWCVPSSCEPKELEWVANQTLPKLIDANVFATVLPSQCHVDEPIELRGIDIFAICLLGCFVLCALLSTIYDIFTEKQANRPTLLLAFSIYSNWPKMLTVNTGQDQLTCLNGIRTISIGWVVLGHVYLVNAALPAINTFDYLPDFIRALERLTIMNATVSVDTFFMMSGLLLSFLFLKEVEKTNRFNVVKFYVHRYIRLTPALAIMVFLTVTIFNYMGTGPLWHSRHDKIKEECSDNWWTNLLYVNNYVNPDRMCLGHTWYLAVDMQLHWLSPLVLVPLWKMRRLFALSWIYFLIALGWAIPFTIVYLMELYPGTYVGPVLKRSETMKYYYWPTHTRYVPWLLGVLLGYILRECRKKKPVIHPVLITCGWILSTVLMTGALNAAYPFQQPDWQYSRLEAAFWMSLFRPLWAVGLGWIIFACDQGFGGLVDKILSWNFFQPLARLSYGVYLTHITILNLFAGVIQSPVYLADVNAIPQFFGVLIMSVAWSIPLALLFESPIILMEKAILGGGKRPAPAAKNEQGVKAAGEKQAPHSDGGSKV